MVNIIAHELSEAVTDPNGTAWYDSNNPPEEVGDKCNFMFQQLWLNVNGGSCALSLAKPVPWRPGDSADFGLRSWVWIRKSLS
jgi:hypothetical protein